MANALVPILRDAANESMPRAAFGRSSRPGVLTELLMKLCANHGGSLLVEAWPNVVQVLVLLRRLDLEPMEWQRLDDFLDEKGDSLSSLRKPRPQPKERRVESGLITGALSLLWVWDSSEAKETAALCEAAEARALASLERLALPQLIEASAFYAIPQLLGLVRALLAAMQAALVEPAPSTPKGPGQVAEVRSAADEEEAVFCLERLRQVVEVNHARLEQTDFPLWPLVAQHLQALLANCADNPSFFAERLVVTLLRFSLRLGVAQALAVFRALPLLPRPVLIAFAQRITAASLVFVRTHGCELTTEGWKDVCTLLLEFRTVPDAAQLAFNCACVAVDLCAGFVSFLPLLATLAAFAEPVKLPATSPIKPKAALEKLLSLHTCLWQPRFTACLQPDPPLASGKELDTAAKDSKENRRNLRKMRCDLWLQSLHTLARLCLDERAAVAAATLEALRRALLIGDMSSPVVWNLAFNRILLPCLEAVVLLPTGPVSRGEAKSEALQARARALQLAEEAFLHALPVLAEFPQFKEFWLILVHWFGKIALAADAPKSQDYSVPPTALSLHVAIALKHLLGNVAVSSRFALAARASGIDLWAVTRTAVTSFRPELSALILDELPAHLISLPIANPVKTSAILRSSAALPSIPFIADLPGPAPGCPPAFADRKVAPDMATPTLSEGIPAAAEIVLETGLLVESNCTPLTLTVRLAEPAIPAPACLPATVAEISNVVLVNSAAPAPTIAQPVTCARAVQHVPCPARTLVTSQNGPELTFSPINSSNKARAVDEFQHPPSDIHLDAQQDKRTEFVASPSLHSDSVAAEPRPELLAASVPGRLVGRLDSDPISGVSDALHILGLEPSSHSRPTGAPTRITPARAPRYTGNMMVI